MVVHRRLEAELVEESCVHGHRPDDVNDAEDHGAVDGAAGNSEAVDPANNREA